MSPSDRDVCCNIYSGIDKESTNTLWLSLSAVYEQCRRVGVGSSSFTCGDVLTARTFHLKAHLNLSVVSSHLIDTQPVSQHGTHSKLELDPLDNLHLIWFTPVHDDPLSFLALAV